jgi:hypothetical protein
VPSASDSYVGQRGHCGGAKHQTNELRPLLYWPDKTCMWHTRSRAVQLATSSRAAASPAARPAPRVCTAYLRLQRTRALPQALALPPPPLHHLLHPPPQLVHGGQLCGRGGWAAGLCGTAGQAAAEGERRLHERPGLGSQVEFWTVEQAASSLASTWQEQVWCKRASPDCATASKVARRERCDSIIVSRRDSFCGTLVAMSA